MACFLYPRTHIANFDLELCERLFDSDHVDDVISLLEFVETVSDVPRRVESGPIDRVRVREDTSKDFESPSCPRSA